MLVSLGARIEGLGASIIEIQGVEQLGGCCYRIIPDRIEAATLMLAAAVTGGTVTVAGIVPHHLQTLLVHLEAGGASIHVQADRVTVRGSGHPLPVSVSAEPYPGLPTDLQAHWTALMATAAGPSLVEDRVFPRVGGTWLN